jgi:hypothetical protein
LQKRSNFEEFSDKSGLNKAGGELTRADCILQGRLAQGCLFLFAEGL